MSQPTGALAKSSSTLPGEENSSLTGHPADPQTSKCLFRCPSERGGRARWSANVQPTYLPTYLATHRN